MNIFQCDMLEWARGDQNEACYCSIAMLHGYKYLLRLALITILNSITFSLRVFLSPSLSHDGRQEGTKCSRSPSKEGSSLSSGGSTPSSAPSGSSPPPGSPSEISSRRPCSPVFEQANPAENVLVVDLSSSSDEEGLVTPHVSKPHDYVNHLFKGP
jgi:hypothetical protein